VGAGAEGSMDRVCHKVDLEGFKFMVRSRKITQKIWYDSASEKLIG
jgi:hypothetical protein